MSRELLSESGLGFDDIEALLFNGGPGSYTGLLIGLSAVLGLSFGRDIPVFAADTLASYAACVDEPTGTTIHAVLDARRRHVYHRAFSVSDGVLVPKSETEVVEIASLPERSKPRDVLIGTGTQRIPEDILSQFTVLDETHISARGILSLYDQSRKSGHSTLLNRVAPEQFEPYYYAAGNVQVHRKLKNK